MRSIYLIIILSFFTTFSFAQSEKEVRSEIEAVTVYLQGAQVTRNFTTTLQSGKNKLILKDLPADLIEKSIKVASSSSQVKVLSINNTIDYIDRNPENQKTKALYSKMEQEQKQLTRKQQLYEVYTEEEALLKQNKSIGGQNGMTVDELKALASYYNERLTSIAMKKLELKEEMDNHRELISNFQQELNKYTNVKPEPKRVVTILTEADGNINSSFTVDYTVKDARWIPSYDVRAQNVSKPIEITYIANVSQQTGEDWKDITLTLSNADPSQSNQVPSLGVWWLGYNQRYYPKNYIQDDMVSGIVKDRKGNGLPGVNVVIQGTTIGTVTDVNGYYELPLTDDASRIVYSFIGYNQKTRSVQGSSQLNVVLSQDKSQLQEVVVAEEAPATLQLRGKASGVNVEYDQDELAATSVVNQTTFEFKVKEPYSINSGVEKERVDLVKYDIPADYTYYSVPKVLPKAYLTASLTDWEQYNFLSGTANLFFEGKYIGNAVIDTRQSVDTLQLSLGQDKSVIIERERIEDFTSKSFFGNRKKEQVGFRISVRNNKAETVEIILEDQVPVSTNDEIEIEVLEKSKGSYNAAKGKVKWKLTLEPGETKELVLKYEVKYPKGKIVYLE